MSADFDSFDLTAGQLNEVVKRLGGHEAVIRFLRGDFVLIKQFPRWREVDGVIYLTVKLDKPTSGSTWVQSRLRMSENRAGEFAKSVLFSKPFKSSSKGTFEVAVLRRLIFADGTRSTANVRAMAERLNLRVPKPDLACLIREQFSDAELEAMGLGMIVVMHQPINDFERDPSLLTSSRLNGGNWLLAYKGYSDITWSPGTGFAFLAPEQVDPS